ncbi:DUF4855 domain-containing protein [Paenibacillus spongiae]|uniref:DUF4855 domain-containing protein n=1 Tax=Paenibacillus spongiae TaxID=2909671 RepID=A0ABY5SHM7_9BACL|nr:DUF4855 domain-containing protein [Paenibacillus spongiae]UVI33489.1 DUF4855 domain-containing protein [Paenibacillus spongiae]
MVSAKKRGFTLMLAAFMLFSLAPSAYAKQETPDPRNLAAGLSYQFSAAPYEGYPDSGNELTDGVYASMEFSDSAWQGHLRGMTREVVFDLQDFKSINAVKTHFIQDTGNGIFYPNTVSMYVSDDGVNWAPLSHKNTAIPLWLPGSPTDQTFVWDIAADGLPKEKKNAEFVYTRYVKVTFMTQVWTFLDEIEIWGIDDKAQHAVKLKPEEPAYLQPGKATGGIRNLALLYNGHYDSGAGDWTKDKIIPYISYVNTQGEPVDWLYDGILYLGIRTQDGQRDFGINAKLEDWQWYLDKTFAPQGDMQQLNEATKEAGAKLGEPKHKTKVVLMVPNPGDEVGEFGDVDGDGVMENFNSDQVGKEAAFADKQKAIDWYMHQVKQRWSEQNYSSLELTGMYWMSESANPYDENNTKIIQHTSQLVHQEKQKFFWIPNFYGKGIFAGEKLGFDAVAQQPNYFFDEPGDPSRIQDSAGLSKQYGIGVEMELDERMNSFPAFRDRYIDYLNGGVDYGYMNDAYKAYYQGNVALLDSARSNDPNNRILYDWMYQFVTKQYQKNDTNVSPETMAELVNRYIALNEIDPAFGNDLSYRLQIIKQLLDENNPSVAVTYMKDFLAHIHDPAVQAQGLISSRIASVLDSYAQVLIHAWSDGWGLSNLVLGQSYTVSKPANVNHPDSGNELTNGQFGGADFRNEQWQGHAGSDYPEERSRTITFDLGQDKSIGQIKAHFLQDAAPGIYFPKNADISVSSDGQSWGKLAAVSPTPTQHGSASAEFMKWNGAIDGVPGIPGADKVYARYVKVEFPINVWVFIDEIEVLGIDGKANGAVVLPTTP